VIEDSGKVTEYPIGLGQNVALLDGAVVEAGMPLRMAQPIRMRF